MIQRFRIAHPTILSALQRHVQASPDSKAYTFLKSDTERISLTYRQLDARARSIAHGLLQEAHPGDRALLTYPAGLDFIEAFLGCLYAGIVAVPAYPLKKNRNADRVLAIIADCEPKLLLGCSDKQANFHELANLVPDSRLVATDLLPLVTGDDLPAHAPSDLAFLQYTSGSTAQPKGVMITHGNIVANEQMIERSFGFTSESFMVSWLPMFHDMGLIGGILAPLFVGFPSVLMAPNQFLREPVKWLQAVTEFRGTTTGAPNFAYDLCVKKITSQQKESLDLSTLKVAYNGAEPVRAETLDAFTKAFECCGFRLEAFFPCYGLAEATLFVSGGPALAPTQILTVDSNAIQKHRVEPAQDGIPVVGCGRLADGLQVRIVDPESCTASPPGEVGELWLQGPSVSNGYYKTSVASESDFAATLLEDKSCWLRTGDYGFLRGDELFITGRLKDLMIFRGRNIYPQEIESLAETTIPFIQHNASAAFLVAQDGLAATVVLVAEATREFVREMKSSNGAALRSAKLRDGLESFRQQVRERLEITVSCIVFVQPTSFPRTSSGKVQRHLCRHLYLTGELQTLYVDELFPTEVAGATELFLTSKQDFKDESAGRLHGVEAVLMQTLKEWSQTEELRSPDFSTSTSLLALGIDSLAAQDISLRLEQRLGIPIDADSFYHKRTVGELAQHLSLFVADQDVAEVVEEKPPKQQLFDRYASQIHRFTDLRNRGLDVFGTPLTQQDGTYVQVGDRRMLMMASYSYLGLVNHREVNAAAEMAIAQYGTGAHGVRLLAGTFESHRALELELADFMYADDALVFSSGFMTNLATVAALVGQGDVVIGDERNHASIHDGCRFSQAEFKTFAHNNLNMLEQLLIDHNGRRILVVVDAVYSMDGDIAPLPAVVQLCRKYGAMLMVDEAHSLGVIGRTGRGIQEHFNLPHDAIDIKMGTLSKSIASCGGFIAARKEIIDFLRHTARGYIFSSALPAAQVEAARKCLEIIVREPERTQQLQAMANRFVIELRNLGFNIPATQSAIIPILFENEQQTLDAVCFCRDRGLFLVPVFYPAVPMDAPRIRATVISQFTDCDLNFALAIFRELKRLGNKAAMIGTHSHFCSKPTGNELFATSTSGRRVNF